MGKCTAKASFQTEQGKQNMTSSCPCPSRDGKWEWPTRDVHTWCHCSDTQRGWFIGMMSLPSPFPNVAVARTANQTSEQAELSLLELFLVEAQISCFSPSPWGSPAQRDRPCLQSQVRLLVPRALWVTCRGCCKTLGCCQHSLDKL